MHMRIICESREEKRITNLQEIEHPGHDHRLLLRESLQGDDRYGHQVYCDGCKEPISSSSSGVGGGGGACYSCPNSDCWFLLHKRCAELPPKIEHPSHPDHALTLSHFILDNHSCDVCDSGIDGFLYRCSDCDFDVHVRCASMALRIQDRVDENKIHQHPLIPIEMEAQFLCAVCGIEHEGKSYLCPICGFWANQICASAPTTVDLHSHPHPFTLFRSFCYGHQKKCIICNEKVKTASWVYRCSEGCGDSVHVGCSLSEKAKNSNSNKDIQPNLHSESTSYKIEIPTDLKDYIILNLWPMPDESTKLITQLIKKLSLQGTHKRATKILCKNDHSLIFVNKKIDESKDGQLCDGCAQTISSQFYHCVQCNFSLHGWCAELPNELPHIFHPKHPLLLCTKQEPICSRTSTLISNVHTNGFMDTRMVADTLCDSCYMHTNGFFYGCFTCNFYLDLKCASLPRLINHRIHDHNLALKRVANNDYPCNACGTFYLGYFSFFRCEACNFELCIKCALLPSSIRHRYDKHPFALTYSPIKGQLDEYYCEICEKDINSLYWFYHCIECDQSLHPKCIYSIERYMIVKFGTSFEVNYHFHLLSFVCRPKVGVLAPCYGCGRHFEEFDYMAYECEHCDFWLHHLCFYSFQEMELTTSMTPPN